MANFESEMRRHILRQVASSKWLETELNEDIDALLSIEGEPRLYLSALADQAPRIVVDMSFADERKTFAFTLGACSEF